MLELTHAWVAMNVYMLASAVYSSCFNVLVTARIEMIFMLRMTSIHRLTKVRRVSIPCFSVTVLVAQAEA